MSGASAQMPENVALWWQSRQHLQIGDPVVHRVAVEWWTTSRSRRSHPGAWRGRGKAGMAPYASKYILTRQLAGALTLAGTSPASA